MVFDRLMRVIDIDQDGKGTYLSPCSIGLESLVSLATRALTLSQLLTPHVSPIHPLLKVEFDEFIALVYSDKGTLLEVLRRKVMVKCAPEGTAPDCPPTQAVAIAVSRRLRETFDSMDHSMDGELPLAAFGDGTAIARTPQQHRSTAVKVYLGAGRSTGWPVLRSSYSMLDHLRSAWSSEL
jgi:hypothetical protein